LTAFDRYDLWFGNSAVSSFAHKGKSTDRIFFPFDFSPPAYARACPSSLHLFSLCLWLSAVFHLLFFLCCFTAVGVVGYVVDTHRLSLGVGVDCLGRFPAVIVSPSSCPATTSGRPSQKSFPKINARVVRIGADGGDGHSLRVELGQFVPIEPTDRLTDTGGGPTAEILTQIFGFPPSHVVATSSALL
jgi:hypothetical protein